MKKKYVAIALLAIGVVMVGLSVALAALETASKDIIGGADWPTFFLVFRLNRAYSLLALGGFVLSAIAIAVWAARKRKA